MCFDANELCFFCYYSGSQQLLLHQSCKWNDQNCTLNFADSAAKFAAVEEAPSIRSENGCGR